MILNPNHVVSVYPRGIAPASGGNGRWLRFLKMGGLRKGVFLTRRGLSLGSWRDLGLGIRLVGGFGGSVDWL